MNNITTINFNGKTILRLDFSQLGWDYQKIMDLLKTVPSYFEGKAEHSVLIMTIVTGMHFNSEIIVQFRNVMAVHDKYVKAASVVGVEGLLKVAYRGVSFITKNMKIFDSEEDAKKWLVLQ